MPGHRDPLPTFHAACVARGLLKDDGEWRLCLQEACEMQTGMRVQHLFATFLLFGPPAQPKLLWNDFRPLICDDLEHHLSAMRMGDPSEEDVYDYGLFLLDKILGESSHLLANFPSMPWPS